MRAPASRPLIYLEGAAIVCATCAWAYRRQDGTPVNGPKIPWTASELFPDTAIPRLIAACPHADYRHAQQRAHWEAEEAVDG